MANMMSEDGKIDGKTDERIWGKISCPNCVYIGTWRGNDDYSGKVLGLDGYRCNDEHLIVRHGVQQWDLELLSLNFDSQSVYKGYYLNFHRKMETPWSFWQSFILKYWQGSTEKLLQFTKEYNEAAASISNMENSCISLFKEILRRNLHYFKRSFAGSIEKFKYSCYNENNSKFYKKSKFLNKDISIEDFI